MKPNWHTQGLDPGLPGGRVAAGIQRQMARPVPEAAVYLVIVLQSAPVSMETLGSFMKTSLGVSDAVFYDGGGSAQMCHGQGGNQGAHKDANFYRRVLEGGTPRDLSSALLVYAQPLHS